MRYSLGVVQDGIRTQYLGSAGIQVKMIGPLV